MEAIGAGPVALDTVVFIYFIEENALYLPFVQPLFQAVDAQRVRAVSSSLTLLEVLVVPYRAGNHALADRYEQILTRGRGLDLLDIDRHQLRVGAYLRAVHPNLRAPDALQPAAALGAGCTSFLTNDRTLPSLPGLPVLQLREFVAS